MKTNQFDTRREPNLYAATFAIRNLVHTPVEVDIENVQEMIATGFVTVAADGVQEGRDCGAKNDCTWAKSRHGR
jgi:hypothetical protein